MRHSQVFVSFSCCLYFLRHFADGVSAHRFRAGVRLVAHSISDTAPFINATLLH